MDQVPWSRSCVASQPRLPESKKSEENDPGLRIIDWGAWPERRGASSREPKHPLRWCSPALAGRPTPILDTLVFPLVHPAEKSPMHKLLEEVLDPQGIA